jgi:hypothetical protein
MSSELRKLEEMTQEQRLCIAVVYGKEGQTTIDEMYANEEGSEDFYLFLSMLGRRVALVDFANQELAKFAGLDATKCVQRESLPLAAELLISDQCGSHGCQVRVCDAF